nr:immunoglobulin light chain junction region [Macaca mulatta]
CLQGYSTPYSL